MATVYFSQMIAAWELSITTLLLIPPLQRITTQSAVAGDYVDAENQRKYLRSEESCL